MEHPVASFVEPRPSLWQRAVAWMVRRGWLAQSIHDNLLDAITLGDFPKVQQQLWHWQQLPVSLKRRPEAFLRAAYVRVIDEKTPSTVHAEIFCQLLDGGLQLGEEEKDMMVLSLSQHQHWACLVALERNQPLTLRQKTLSFVLLLDHSLDDEDMGRVFAWLETGHFDPTQSCHISDKPPYSEAGKYTMLGHALKVGPAALVAKLLDMAPETLHAQRYGEICWRHLPLTTAIILHMEERGWRWEDVLRDRFPTHMPAERVDALFRSNMRLAQEINRAWDIRTAKLASETLERSTPCGSGRALQRL